MGQQGVTDDSLQDFGAEGEKGDTTIVIRILFVTFFVDGDNVGVFPDLGEDSLRNGEPAKDFKGDGQLRGALVDNTSAEPVWATGLVLTNAEKQRVNFARWDNELV